MNLTKVTITGIDERTDIQRLVMLHDRYPFVEFGVLLSYHYQENGNRYPAPQWLKELPKGMLSLSAHLCGHAALDVIAGKRFKYAPLFSGCRFRRCQLNIDVASHWSALRSLKPVPFIREVIVQMKTAELCHRYLHGQKPRHVACLIDASGGQGIDSPLEIVTYPGEHIGYAGGIGPDNVEEKLRTLLEYPSDEKFWIDMESRVRTDDWLDLEKVEEVLDVCDRLTKAVHPQVCY